MKLGLISDVHGDPVALGLAWSHLTRLGADRIVCAGDVVGYGPLPDPVVAFLKEHQVPCVRGNHDRWALERGPGVPDPFGTAAPSVETLAFLAGLPFDVLVAGDGKIVVVVHGSYRDDMEFVTSRDHPPRVLRGWLDELGCDVLVVGHTHDPMVCRTGRGLVVNPGSVVSVVPRPVSSRTFALLDLATFEVTHHDVGSGQRLEVAPWVDEALGRAPQE
jgi:putative phosphoesterase